MTADSSAIDSSPGDSSTITDAVVAASPLLRNAEAVMTGTVVCAAVIAAGVGHTESIRQLCLAISLTVFIYWCAHLYAAALAGAIAHRKHPLHAARDAIAHTWLVGGASLLPLGILVTANLLGAELKPAATIALAATVGLLALYGGIAGHRGGFGPKGVTVSALGGAFIGLLVVGMKLLLH